jgi:hypothetical protein
MIALIHGLLFLEALTVFILFLVFAIIGESLD